MESGYTEAVLKKVENGFEVTVAGATDVFTDLASALDFLKGKFVEASGAGEGAGTATGTGEKASDSTGAAGADSSAAAV